MDRLPAAGCGRQQYGAQTLATRIREFVSTPAALNLAPGVFVVCLPARSLTRFLTASTRLVLILWDRIPIHPPVRVSILATAAWHLVHNNGRGCKEAALEGVIQVFDRLDAEAEAADRQDAGGADGHIPIRRVRGGGGGAGGPGDDGGGLGANSTEELRFVEGTILLHFNFAMKQDHNLASCVLKGFQRRAAAAEVRRACTPFRLALLLSLSRIQRFSQPVLDLVQDIVSDCLVYDHAREGSAWLESEEEVARGGRYGGGCAAEDAGSDEEGGGGGGIGSGSSSSARVVQRVLLKVIASSRGWDHLMESFLKIGLQLLDRGGAGAAGVSSCPGAAAGGMLEKLQGAQPRRASLRASHLGRVVLMETFKTHEVSTEGEGLLATYGIPP